MPSVTTELVCDESCQFPLDKGHYISVFFAACAGIAKAITINIKTISINTLLFFIAFLLTKKLSANGTEFNPYSQLAATVQVLLVLRPFSFATPPFNECAQYSFLSC